MIEKISFGLMNESGDSATTSDAPRFGLIEEKTETTIADTFTQICFANNNHRDDETRIYEKFTFLLNLKNYLKEMKNYASR